MLIMLGFALAYFRFWKLHRFRAFIPLVVWSFTLVGPILLAHYARDLYFETMISNLEKEIDVYRKTGIYTETEVFGYGGVSTFVNDRRDTIITYWWGGGFPVKHTALLYFNSPESTFVQGGPLALKEAGWRHGYLIQDNWYVASN